ncbi:tricorn protease N-terminal domain-containing protein [Aureobasidium pullulans]|uniref:Tricorn protease N-terminal domain-containing protein n=1 Tax=Aureobasidium pullulans TaxID=5580 RepID=A0A4S9UAT4_AURPU|nr:tricorn protease N-terminal domain-containing protein [Aureobasidium pullulans]THZ34477.1 tricorn protease N-terminal domain-containing protein [Aureobasidium pullulans]THZ51323.1 tricorn protease N-terminal domain-containing protein [Aureobasidium pullulans]THZ89705.1 tricorn protease N-terminal domain-containing protein [Aureobasidium pullulans]
MRFFPIAAFGLSVGTSLAACPYADKAAARPDCPYASIGKSKLARYGNETNRTSPSADKNGVFYFNRIAPSGSQLWISNADGSNATKLMSNQTAPFDYHASWSSDGQRIIFTSERRADGQSDLYQVNTDGTELTELVSSDSFEDIGSLSPDGKKLAYVSTAINYTTNIFVKDLHTGISINVTGSDESVGSFVGPHSFFRPSWSPDGHWITFSSDAGTQWTGHSEGTGWEHTQSLAVFVVRPDGSGFRKVIGEESRCLGTPRWSPDASRIVYYNISTEDTYGAHGTVAGQELAVFSQIFSVDVATGSDVVPHTFDNTLKVSPAYLGNSSNIGYLVKAGTEAGIHYTSPDTTHHYINSTMRNPAWSPDGSKVVYEIYEWGQRPAEKELFSWDDEWDYRFMDVFPSFSTATGRLATTEKQLGNGSSSIVLTGADYTNITTAFDTWNINASEEYAELYASGLAGAFQPTWTADGSKLATGFGVWFFDRILYPGTLYSFDADGTAAQNLTDGTNNAGFPSFSPDGTKLVYRLWNATYGPLGLHVLDMETGDTTQLTAGWDNTPGWSPDGELIVFTRQTNWTSGSSWQEDRFDICTIRPDGTDLKILTESEANDAHAVWSFDGRIMYSTGMYGFRDESVMYDNTFQPYGQIVVMDKDRQNKKMLTDSMWEDSMPLYVERKFF